LIRSIRVAHAMVRAAGAFLSTLVRRRPAAASGMVPDGPRARLSSSSELRSAGVENRCPVCQARFRGARICSRCGADLGPLMLLAVEAWQLRQAARQALDAGDVERALALAGEAEGIQGTGSGEALRLLGAWLLADVN
jgi:IS5 family transposase